MRSHLLCANPWAIHPEAMQWLTQLCASPTSAKIPQDNASSLLTSHRVEPFNAQPLSGKVAILPIRGMILPYTSVLATLFGATCLDRLTEDFCAARDNPDIETIVLNIDSPGGMVTGVHAFSQQVFAARPVKPIIAMVSGLAASAAYWIAASSTQVFVDPTASVGSIGVVMTYTDNAEQQKKAGVQTLEIVSSQSPCKRLDAATEEGHRVLQAQVDALADVFVAAVATYRDVPVATVLSDFGQGGLLVGEAAVTQGLADGCQTLPIVLTAFISTPTGDIVMHTETPSPITAENPLRSDTPNPLSIAETDAAYEQGFAAGLQAGKDQECSRIQAIEAHSVPGHETLIARLKFDGVSTEKEVALQILAAEKVQREQQHQARMDDAPQPLPPLNMVAAASPPLSLEEQCQAEWASSSPLRAEFYSLEGYIAYRKAESQGLIKGLKKEENTRC